MNGTIQSKVVSTLTGEANLRVFTPNQLTDSLRKHGIELKNANRTIVLNRLVKEKILVQVRHGIYLNRLARPEPTKLEALPLIRNGAVLSLASVLSESGILTNPNQEITAVAPNTKVKRGFGEGDNEIDFKVYLLPKACFPEIGDEDAWQPQFGSTIMRATPEKALLDWIYLASENKITPVPRSTMELDELDAERLDRLADKMRMNEQWETWQAEQLTDKRGGTMESKTNQVDTHGATNKLGR